MLIGGRVNGVRRRIVSVVYMIYVPRTSSECRRLPSVPCARQSGLGKTMSGRRRLRRRRNTCRGNEGVRLLPRLEEVTRPRRMRVKKRKNKTIPELLSWSSSSVCSLNHGALELLVKDCNL